MVSEPWIQVAAGSFLNADWIVGVENVVIIDNIPKIPPARLEKLNSIVRKLFSGCGTIVNVEYPTDEEGNTKGYAFLEYKDSSSAEKAVKILNNHRLDKAHTFSVNLFCDVWTWVNFLI